MTKVKLVNETTINADNIDLVSGALQITTSEHSVEELANIFSDKSNTCLLTLLTEADVESGYYEGFTSFAGIIYNAEGSKVIQMFQPKDTSESRISSAECAAALARNDASAALKVSGEASAAAGDALNAANKASNEAVAVATQNETLAATVDSILTEVIPSLMM